MNLKAVEERMNRMEHKNALLMLVSLGAVISTQSQQNKWLKLPFIIADSLLIVDTAMEIVQTIKYSK